MDSRLKEVTAKIGAVPDFPKPGILFRDIFPVLRDPKAFGTLNDLLFEHAQSLGKIDVVLGLESRGFIFGPILAQRLAVAFVPVRKRGKLPGECIRVDYQLEYGTDSFEVQKDSLIEGQKVLIIDDLIATGGTMRAAIDLMKTMKCEVAECLVVIELTDLKGAATLSAPFHSLVQYEGE